MLASQVKLEYGSITNALPKFYFYWKTYYWTFLFSIFSTSILLPEKLPNVREFLAWSLIAILAHLAILPFFIYAQNHRTAKYQISLMILAGLSRGVVIVIAAPLFGVADPSLFYFRILSSTTALVYWFLFGSILVEFMSNFRKDVRKLLEESISESRDLELLSPDVNSQALLAQIAELKERVTETLEGDSSPANLKRRAADIEKLVKSHIRPLSQSEWHGDDLRWARAGSVRVLIVALRRYPLPLWGTIFVTLPFSIADQLPRYGILKTATTVSIWIAVLILIKSISIRIAPSINADFLKLNTIFFSGIFIIAVPVMLIVHASWPGDDYSNQYLIRTVLARNLAFVVLSCVSIICICLVQDERSVFRTLSLGVKSRDEQAFLFSGMLDRSGADYAQYLHAVVQSQLVACKLLLLKFAEDDFSGTSPEIVKQILGRLEEIEVPYVVKPKKLPLERMQDLAQSWKGIATITYDIDEDFGDSSHSRDTAMQLVEEGIVNSIRHGKANQIHVAIRASSASIEISVSDDGVFAGPSKSSGLGSILFDTFTSSWSINRELGTTVLRMSIAQPTQ